VLKREYILPLVIAAALVLLPAKAGGGEKSYLGRDHLPRGIRNNNPGNLKIGPSPWQGKIPVAMNTDGVFEQFETWQFGVRAMVKLILNYIAAGRDTIREVVERYAPGSENDTAGYIQFVANRAGLSPDEKLGPENLYPVIDAMVAIENGEQWGITYQEYFNSLS